MKKILTTLLLVLGAVVPFSLNAMDVEPQHRSVNLEKFKIQFTDRSHNQREFHFRRTSYETMSEADMKQFMTLVDIQAVYSEFNSVPLAIILPLASEFFPEKLIDMAKKNKMNAAKKLEEKNIRKVDYLWLIEEETQWGVLPVGHLSFHSYAGNKPAGYEDTFLLEIGYSLHKNYRQKGYTKALMPYVLSYVASHHDFNDSVFCFRTEASNQGMHAIANRLGLEIIFNGPMNCDFGDFEKEMQCHMYIIPSKLYQKDHTEKS